MKIFITITLIVLGATWVQTQKLNELPKFLQDFANQNIGACKTEYSITEEVYEDIKKGNYEGSDQVPCFLKCALLKTKTTDESGKIIKKSIVDEFAQFLNGKENAEKIYNACKNFEDADNSCGAAVRIYDCFRAYEAGFL